MPISKSQGSADLIKPKTDTNSQNLKLLKAEISPSLSGPTGGAEVIIDGGALIASSNFSGDNKEKPKIVRAGSDSISVYIVRDGDTLSQIAEMFGVKVSTIRGFNNIRRDIDLRAGQELLILPVDGILYKVEKGDTLSSVAKKFKSDEMDIALFNDLPEDGKLAVGGEIIIPNAEPLPEPKAVVISTPKSTVSAPKPASSAGGSYSAGFYTHPVPRGSVKSQGFHGPYQAQDLAAPTGTPIVASSAGRVIAVRFGWNGGYGNMIIIDDGTANVLYAHLSEITVSQGQVVSQGEVIGKVGSTGRSTGPHLHIEYRGKNGPIKTPVW